MSMQNPFDTPHFNLASMTAAINHLPNQYGRLGELNLFPVKSVRHPAVIMEEKQGILNLIESKPRGGEADVERRAKRTVRSFAVPHFPMDDSVMPDEYANIRAFGQESAPAQLAAIVNDHLAAIRARHEITLEWLRMSALNGIVRDADNSVIYDLHTEFGVSKKSVDFDLGTGGTNVQTKCFEVTRHIEDNLTGEVMNGVRCLVHQDFFDALVSHASVQRAWDNWQSSSDKLGSDPRKGFQFAGLIFEEYRGVATDKDGNSRQFVTTDEGLAFPTGTRNAFATLVAPADFLETVNTPGQLYYAKQQARQYNRGIDIHTQMNALPICYRPDLMVRLHTST